MRDEPLPTASTGAVPPQSSIKLITPDEQQESLVSLKDALAIALGQAQYALSENGDIVVDFALSTTLAEDAIYYSEAGPEAPSPRPVVVVRDTSIFDECAAIRIRTKLVAYSRETGELIASREAEAISCDDDPPPYDDLAKLLVGQLSD